MPPSDISVRVFPLLITCLILTTGLTGVGCARTQGSVPVHAASDSTDVHGRLLIELARRVESGAFRPEAASYDFGPEGASQFLLDGWSNPERAPDGEWFTWATSRTAQIKLELFDERQRWLHFAANAFAVGPDITQTATVRIDNIELGTVTLEPGGFVVDSLAVPSGVTTRGDHVVSFAFDYARSPSSLSSTQDDTRTLAAAFDFIALTTEERPPRQAPVPLEPLGVDGVDARERLRLATGSETAFSIMVPPTGFLAFGLSTAAAAPSSELRGEVWLRNGNGTAELFLDEAPTGNQAWHADLSAWSGERVTLAFRAVGGRSGDALDWIAPTLYGETGSLNVATDVVLIVVDTLRADALGAYGSDAHTPQIDALARSGVRFSRAYAHIPITLPSHSSMFTSLLPTEHGAFTNGSVLGDGHTTLAEVLRDHHRHTAGFVSLGVLGREFGLAQGFETYVDDFADDWWLNAGEMNQRILPWLAAGPATPFFLWAHYSDPHEPYTPPGRSYPEVHATFAGPPSSVLDFPADGTIATIELEIPPGESEVHLTRVGESDFPLRLNNIRTTSPEVTARCTEGCRARRPGPDIREFVTAMPAAVLVDNPTGATVRTSLLIQASEDIDLRQARLRYREEVEYLDHHIGELVTAIRAVSKDTLIVLTADHGEELGEHGSPGHIAYLYEPAIRVPLIVSWPGHLPVGLVVEDTVSHMDLLPTLVELLALEDPTHRSGQSLVPLLTPTARRPIEPVVAETFRPESPRTRRALVGERYKLILTPQDSRTELYDLERDPGERESLAAAEPEMTASLQQTLTDRLAEAESHAPNAPEPTLSEEQLDRLRSLGYVRE